MADELLHGVLFFNRAQCALHGLIINVCTVFGSGPWRPAGAGLTAPRPGGKSVAECRYLRGSNKQASVLCRYHFIQHFDGAG